MKQWSLVWRGNGTEWRRCGPWPTGCHWEWRQQAIHMQMCEITPHRDMCLEKSRAEQGAGEWREVRDFPHLITIWVVQGGHRRSLSLGKIWAKTSVTNRMVARRVKPITKISSGKLSTWNIGVINTSTKRISSSVKNYITMLSEKNREMFKSKPRHNNNRNNNNDTIILSSLLSDNDNNKKKHSIKSITLWLHNIAKYFQTERSSEVIYVELFILLHPACFR